MNIVVTGASRGIGYEVAKKFAADKGNIVFALSRNEAGLKKLSAEPAAGKLVTLRCDITDLGSVEAAMKEIRNGAGSIEILVNNAGVLHLKDFEELTLEDWKEIYGVNVFGAITITKQLLPLMRKGKLAGEVKAHIVNISSMGGIQGSMKFKGLSAYSSSKGAMVIMTECLSEEFKSEGIRVNCIALGSVETEMFKRAFPGYEASSDVEKTAGWIREFAEKGSEFFNGKTVQLSTTTP